MRPRNPKQENLILSRLQDLATSAPTKALREHHAATLADYRATVSARDAAEIVERRMGDSPFARFEQSLTTNTTDR
jgi:hypothetical protein